MLPSGRRVILKLVQLLLLRVASRLVDVLDPDLLRILTLLGYLGGPTAKRKVVARDRTGRQQEAVQGAVRQHA